MYIRITSYLIDVCRVFKKYKKKNKYFFLPKLNISYCSNRVLLYILVNIINLFLKYVFLYKLYNSSKYSIIIY